MNIQRTLGIAMLVLAVSLAGERVASAQDHKDGSTQESYVQEPVTVSKEKVKVNGKLCYSHVVLERQTLYSVSKAYGVSIEDIYKYNPSVRTEGLKKNAIILIPVVEQQNDLREKPKKDEVKIEQKKETPKEAKVKTVNEPKVHIVKWYETIETIASKYDVRVEDIMKANKLTSKELKSRQRLVIPQSTDLGKDELEEAAAEGRDRAEGKTAAKDAGKQDVKETEKQSEPNKETRQEDVNTDNTEAAAQQESEVTYSPKNNVSLALMLPLKASSDKPNTNAMDLYCGALLAARDLGTEGVNVNIDVFDTSDAAMKAEPRKIDGEDFIVGPISPSDIRRIYSMIGREKILISPLDPKGAELVGEYPNLIQVPTPHDFQYADLAQWISDEFQSGDRTILITEKGAQQSEAMKNLVNMIDLCGLKYTSVKYSILEGRDIIGTLKKASAEGDTHMNRFIIASESEAFVNDAFRNISLLSRENRKVEIFCHSKVRGYDIEVESLHNNDLHVSLAYYIDYNAPEVIRFVKQYRALFNTEPTQFSFQGYDIVKYFSQQCAKYGDEWFNALGKDKKTMLQTTFDFRDGSRINEGIRRIEYKDNYQIIAVQ